LAVAESGLDDAISAERCRKLLVAGRPDPWVTSFPTIGQALAHPPGGGEVDRLPVAYPPAPLFSLLLRPRAPRGPFTGPRPPLASVLDDLGSVRIPARTRQASAPPPALPFSAATAATAAKTERADDPQGILNFYLTVLMAIAILLASVQPPVAQDTKAA